MAETGRERVNMNKLKRMFDDVIKHVQDSLKKPVPYHVERAVLPPWLVDSTEWTLPDGIDVPLFKIEIDPDDWKLQTGSEGK